MQKWAFAVIGIALVITGCLFGFMWWNDKSSAIPAMVAIFGICGGGYLSWLGLRAVFGNRDYSESNKSILGLKRTKTNYNCLNIYGEKVDDKRYRAVKMELVNLPDAASLGGYQKRCENNSRRYYVNYFDIQAQKLRPWTVPDTKFLSPKEVGAALSQTGIKEALKLSPGMMKLIGPGIMAVGLIITLVLIYLIGAE